MKRGAFYILIGLILGLAAACSHHWRDSNPQATGAQVFAMLEKAQASGSFGNDSSAITKAYNLASTGDSTTVYFNDAPRPGYPLGGAFAFKSLEFLPAAAVAKGKVIGARVFFVEHAKGHDDYLILGLLQAGSMDEQDEDVSSSFTYYSYVGQGSVDHGQYVFNFKGDGDKLFTLRSTDTSGADLAGVVQLRMYNAAGTELGKFSTLTGYQ